MRGLVLAWLLGLSPSQATLPWSPAHCGTFEVAAIASGKTKRPSDAEVRNRMIEESIDSYPGNCACPYQRAKNGSQCGRRSAYNREGGYAPLCYPSDISDDMVRRYRAEMGLR